MSGGEELGWVTTLPVVAVLGLLGNSVLLAYGIRVLASRFDTRLQFPRGGLVLTCVVAQLLILSTTGVALDSIGGIPPGPSFEVGPPWPTLFVVYGIPLMVVSTLFGMVIDRRGHGGVPRSLGSLSSISFAVVHLLTVPVVWFIFILVDTY